MSVTPPTIAARSIPPTAVRECLSTRPEAGSASGTLQRPQENADDVAAELAAEFFASFEHTAGRSATRSADSHSEPSSYRSITSADDSSDDDSETKRGKIAGLNGLTFDDILDHVGDNTPEKENRGRRGSNATTTSTHSQLISLTVDSRFESGQATADVIALLTLAKNDLLGDLECLNAIMEETKYRFQFGTDDTGAYIGLSSIRNSNSQKYVMYNDPNTNLTWTTEQFTAMQTAVREYYESNSRGGGAPASVERR
jgi:hypothetical protein